MWEVYLSFARIQFGWDGSIDINFQDLIQIVVATKALQLIMKSLVHVTCDLGDPESECCKEHFGKETRQIRNVQ